MVVEIRYVSPVEVKLDSNIRKEVIVDPAFIDSIRSQGVLNPVLGYLDLLGELNVHDGQRRVLAARQAGLETIPVLVGPAPGSEEARIMEQFALNEARSAMTLKDKVAAVQQLHLFGMESEDIARKVGRSRREVDELLSLGESPMGSALAEEIPDLTIQQAAAIAELEADSAFSESDAKRLEEDIRKSPERANHSIQWAADKLARNKASAALRAELEADGHTVLDEYPNRSGMMSKHFLERNEHEEITLDSHKDCPGHRAFVGSATSIERVAYFCFNPDLHKPQHILDEERVAREEEQRQKRLARERKQLWTSAAKVRHEYLKALIIDPPRDAVEWAIRSMMPVERQSKWNLDNPFSWINDAGVLPTKVSMQAWANLTKKGAHTVLFAAALSTFEKVMRSDEAWQQEDKANYLSQLADWGYGLAEIEEELIQSVKGKAEVD